jgi:hypothetical protein
MGLFDRPQPGAVFLAAAFGALAGGVTLVGAVIVGGTGSTDAVGWLVTGAQVVAAALLIGGGISLLMGVGRTALIAGAVLDLLLCAVHLWYALAEQPGLIAVPFGFAVVVAASLVLALRRVTREYLATDLPATRRDLRPSPRADLGS